MSRATDVIRLLDSEEKFWVKVYKSGEDHWIDKEPSNLTKSVVRKYKEFDNVLEIGCAAGIDTFLLASVTKNRIVGIDIVEAPIKIAKENLSNQSKAVKDKTSFEVGDAEKLRFKDKSFDFVYSLSVLHSTNLSKSLSEVRRVLTDNGKAVIYVYVGDGKEKITEKEFLDTCNKHFTVEDQKKVDVKDKGGDVHKALIVWLEVKND